MSSSEPAGIQAISKADVHRITSGQVVLDIQSAVKELVENALDAGARAIEVRFKEHGSEAIEVVDNGSGIRADNYASLALKHHTSKLNNFHDLTLVQTFGFRGEALSSLCELSEVQVVTATKEEEPVGTVLEMNRDGTIRSQDKRVARQRGTTVTITGLFSTLPVRRRELLKNVKREFAKAQSLLQAYAIISRGVRWVVTNTVKGRKTSIMTMTGSDMAGYIHANTSAVFGTKACASLISLDLQIPIQSRMRENGGKRDKDGEEEGIISVQGLISRPTHGSGRSASDRIFLYLNGRPWDSSRILRAFNEVYKTFNSNQYPLVVANFTVGGDRYDVNVSPDKRTLLLHDEGEIIDGLKTSLEEMFTPYLSTYTVNGANLTAAKDAAQQSQLAFKPKRANTEQVEDEEEEEVEGVAELEGHEPPVLQQEEADHPNAKRPRFESHDSSAEYELAVDPSTLKRPQVSEDVDGHEDGIVSVDSSLGSWSPPKRARESTREEPDTAMKNASRGRNASQTTTAAKLKSSGQAPKTWTSQLKLFAAPTGDAKNGSNEVEEEEIEDDDETCNNDDELEYREQGLTIEQHKDAAQQRQKYQDESLHGVVDMEEEEDDDDDEAEEAERDANLSRLEEQGAGESSQDVANGWKSEMIAHVEYTGDLMQIHLDMTELRRRIASRAESEAMTRSAIRTDAHQFKQAGVEEKDAEAVEVTLSRSIEKSDFAGMTVVGQFNLGFIVARRSKGEEDDVFIIDQHAADEKFNFETLQRETKLKSQMLIRPRRLELPSSVEFVAAQHIKTLAAHGFQVKVDEEAMPGARVELIALPLTKSTAFGVGDLEELLHKLAEVAPDSARARSLRCSRLYNVLASRACRKSVMIGKALTKRQMGVVLQHMGEIEQPWNCPHGRPTMRHLHRLDLYPSSNSSNTAAAINWQSLL